MKALKITLECQGDVLTSITQTIKIAKALGEESLPLYFKEGFIIHVRATSDFLDVMEIHRTQVALKNAQKDAAKTD